MNTNNLNPLANHPSASLPTPTPAPSGMSVLAKLVVGVAALFFAVYICIGISGFISSLRKEDELDESQRREVERITLALHGFFENTPPAYAEEFGRIYAKFTGECSITAHDIEAANLLLANLSSPASAESSVRVDPSRETNEQRRRLREQQDQEFAEARMADQLRKAQERSLRERETAMTKALTPLNAEISEATEALGVRLGALNPLQECWRMVSNYASFNIKLRAEETYAIVFEGFEKRFGVAESLDRSIPEDCYHEAVTRFNAQFPDEGEAFAQKRTTLDKSYKAYTAQLSEVRERLAWVRLRAYHDRVGEEFFTTHFSRDLLGKICRGEEVPLPQ